MKKTGKIALAMVTALTLVNCGTDVAHQNTSSFLSGRMQYAPTNHYSPIKEDFTALAKKYNFAELEKEYKSFSTKALADTYVKKMFNKFLIVTSNSVQVIRQVEFSRYLKNSGDTSYETSLKNIFTDTPVLYSSLTGMAAVQSKMTSESGTFGFYILGVSPNQTVSTALPATNITETSFTANWSAVTGATSYILIVDGVEIPGITGTNHTLNSLTAGSNHKYRVKAITSGVAGAVSNEINVNTVLTAPVASSATGITQTSLTANWSTVSGATSYTLVFNGTETTGITGTSHTVNSLTPGTSYSYYVKAVNANTESVNSSTINTATVPSNPTANAASSVTSTSFTANWTAVTGATGYKLYIDNVLEYAGTNLSYNKTDLTKGSSYSYCVKAINSSGDSTDSNIINLSTLDFSTLTEINSIPTNGAVDLKFFTIGTNHYIAVANYRDSSTNFKVDSKIYKWNSGTGQFDTTPIQTIATNGGYKWEQFIIGTDNYLVLANSYDGTSKNINSKIYKWNGTQFVEFQSILTNGAYDWDYFTIGADSYLVVANSYNGTSKNISSKIYKWNGTQFVEFQSIPTSGGEAWNALTIGTDHYLTVANASDGSLYNINSKIYKWNGTQFVEFQSIPTNGADDWESFTIGTDAYLTVANFYNGTTRNIDSKIYKWNGTQFVEFQSILTNGANDWESFTIGANTYITVANYSNNASGNINSNIYRWNSTTNQFDLFNSVLTHNAYRWEAFTIGTNHYLAVANYNDGTSFNTNSKIYRLD